MHFYLGLYGDSGNEMLGIKESEPGHTGVCLVLCVSDNHHGPTPRCLSKGSDFFLYVFLWGEKKIVRFILLVLLLAFNVM